MIKHGQSKITKTYRACKEMKKRCGNPNAAGYVNYGINDAQLCAFVHESNRIEGIDRYPTKAELDATLAFIDLQTVEINDLIKLVAVYQPNAVLRDKPGLNVRVGNYFAPDGGRAVREGLKDILEWMSLYSPWQLHVKYEKLHPFTDGNGRSGRALWAWQMVRLQRGLPLGFLHQFYYQTLEASQ